MARCNIHRGQVVPALAVFSTTIQGWWNLTLRTCVADYSCGLIRD